MTQTYFRLMLTWVIPLDNNHSFTFVKELLKVL